jgi:hypothetical protein
MKERVKSREAADILGLTRSMVTRSAGQGNIPGAAKIGGSWTFDREKLRKFILEKEYECQKKISTFAVTHGGYRLPSVASSTDVRYTQAMLRLQGKLGTKSLSKSKQQNGAER